MILIPFLFSQENGFSLLLYLSSLEWFLYYLTPRIPLISMTYIIQHSESAHNSFHVVYISLFSLVIYFSPVMKLPPGCRIHSDADFNEVSVEISPFNVHEYSLAIVCWGCPGALAFTGDWLSSYESLALSYWNWLAAGDEINPLCAKLFWGNKYVFAFLPFINIEIAQVTEILAPGI